MEIIRVAPRVESLPSDPRFEASRPGGGEPEAALSFRRIVQALRRRKGLVLCMVLLGLALAGLAAAMMPPTYTATAQIVVDLRAFQSGNAATSSQSMEEAAMDNHLTMLTSESYLRTVLTSLAHDPDVNPPATATPPSWMQTQRAKLLDAFSHLADLVRRDPVGGPDAETARRETKELVRLQQVLNVHQERRSGVITVAYPDSNPRKAAAVANAVVRLYAEGQTAQRQAESTRTLKWLEQQIPEVQQEMAHAEEAVQTYRVAHGGVAVGAVDEINRQIAQTSWQLSTAKADADTAQAQLAKIREMRRAGATSQALADVIGSPTLSKLVRLEADAAGSGQQADLRRSVDQEIDRALQQLDGEGRADQAQVRSIEDRLDLLKTSGATIAAQQSGLRALEQQASAASQLLDTLLRRRQDTNERLQLGGSDVQVLALATPPVWPTSLHPLFLIPPALVAFGIVGCVLAVGLDRLDRRLRTRREVAEALGIPCAGLVPNPPRRYRASLYRHLIDHPATPYAKAIRAVLVASLPLPSPHRTSSLVLVSSALPGEGKTELALSLSVAAAQLGWRALLIELGPRAPTSMAETRVPPAADLADVLARGRPATDAVGRIPSLGLDYLPAPRLHSGLPSALAGRQASALLRQLREIYDCIIIDGPAALGAPETRLLAAQVDEVLFAVRWASTSRDVALSGLQVLTSGTSSELGSTARFNAVLTRVNLRRHLRDRRGDDAEHVLRT